MIGGSEDYGDEGSTFRISAMFVSILSISVIIFTMFFNMVDLVSCELMAKSK